jgi:putative DNA primase/helicase
MQMSDAIAVTTGRWHGILSTLGVPAEALRDKHGPCPLGCGGKKSFRFDNKGQRGTWICTHCGAGDGFDLLVRMGCGSMKDVMREAARVAGLVEAEPERKKADVSATRRRMQAIWESSAPISRDDPAGLYLHRRLGRMPSGTGLRYAKTEYFEGDVRVGTMPTMLAPVLSPAGDFVGLHRTYLTVSGHKAPVDSAKKLLRCGPLEGAAVRLAPAAAVMGVAEGIETALSASFRFLLPVWSALSANGIEKFEPLAKVKHLDIFSDNDISGTGQLASYKLMNRLFLTNKGVSTSVIVPPRPDTDWADYEEGE